MEDNFNAMSEKGMSMRRLPTDSGEPSMRNMDVYDANGEVLSQDNDETHSSDSEEDEDTDTRYVRGGIVRQRSSSMSIDKNSDGIAAGDGDNFDDEVQRMDLNIETLNEQGATIT